MTVGEIEGSGDQLEVIVTVATHEKAVALEQLLRKTVSFGNVTLTVRVHETGENRPADVLKAAFAYNPMVSAVYEVEGTGAAMGRTYVVFEPDVVQFFNDDLTDYLGNFTAIAADVARDLFNVEGNVSFCTRDLEENSVE